MLNFIFSSRKHSIWGPTNAKVQTFGLAHPWGIPQTPLSNLTADREEVITMSKYEANRKRNIEKRVRFTQAEWTMVQDRMKRCGYNSFNEYCCMMLINGCILVIDDRKELKEYIYEINKIGTNINQIAYIGNTTGCISKKDVETIKDMMFMIWGQVRQLLFGTPTKEQEAATEKICDMYAGILQDD